MSPTKPWLFSLLPFLIQCSLVQARQEDDLARMQGVWLTELCHINGTPASEDDRLRSKTTVVGATLTFSSGPMLKKYRIELRPQSSPKEVDLFRDENKVSGIYEITQDEFKLCVPIAETGSRPKGFQSLSESGVVLMVLKHSNEPPPPLVIAFLNEAKVADGIKHYQKRLLTKKEDQQAIAALRLLQTASAIEGLAQDYYRYGFSQQRLGMIGLIQIPVPPNSAPEEISYADARGVFSKFLERLKVAESTLGKFKPTQLKILLDVSEIFIDIDGKGKKLSLVQVMLQMTNPRPVGQAALLQPVVFAFDDADVVWLRGYVHLLSAVVETVLAHNWEEAFDRSAHLFFPRVKSDFSFLAKERESQPGDQNGRSWDWPSIVDFISLVHMMRFEVDEPKRMLSALSHMEKVIQLSRETWRLIRLETDNDQEFIPNSKQNSTMISNQLGGQFGEHWEKVLDRAQSILDGKELLPYWRGFAGAHQWNTRTTAPFHPTLGINFRKIFTHPKRFDLVLWLQGTGVQPYLEEGTILNGDAWQSIANPFGGNLPFFALWFN